MAWTDRPGSRRATARGGVLTRGSRRGLRRAALVVVPLTLVVACSAPPAAPTAAPAPATDVPVVDVGVPGPGGPDPADGTSTAPSVPTAAAEDARDPVPVGDVTLTWPEPTEVSRVGWSGGGPDPVEATLTFADGSVVEVHGRAGLDEQFPARTTTGVVISVRSPTGADTGLLDGWEVDDVAPTPPVAAPSPPVAVRTPLVAAPAPDAAVPGASGSTRPGTTRPGTTAPVVGAPRPSTPAPAPVLVDLPEGQPGGAVSDTVATASSNAAGAWALADGRVEQGSAGASWTAAATDSTPSVRVAFAAPRQISSVLVLGLVQDVYDPGHLSDAPLRGTLVFDDGSRVGVDGISGAVDEATVIAFPPRTTSGVTLELRRTLAGATLGLREIAAFDRGVTPPRWGAHRGPTYAVSAPAAGSCPVPTTTTGPVLQLVCPAIGTAVDGTAVVTVRARTSVGATLVARAWRADTASTGSVEVVASAVVQPDGLARLSVPLDRLPHGPVGVQVRLSTAPSTSSPTVQAQLFNRGGVVLDARDHAPAGTTLQWSEEFTTPLSVSRWGRGATYAAVKPEFWGGSEFGQAVLADPASGAGGLATLEQEYLRIRVSPLNGAADPAGWGRVHTSGLLSSSRVGGSGFAAQHGWFEARMLAPGGIGTWPAFWMLDTAGSVDHTATQAEVDAVELYGPHTLGSCHTVHNWRIDAPTDPAACPDPNGFADSSLAWHTYAVQIRDGGADFYIDGRWVASRNGMLSGDRPFFFMLNLALGGGWPVDLSPTNQTADLYVDWVRVYT